MVTSSTIEPNPEFNERRRAIMREWQSGEMPFIKAAAKIEEMAQEAIADNNLADQARVEFTLGYMQGYRSNLNASITHFERARDLFEQIGDEKRITSCDLNLGETYRQKGDFTRARELFHTAYDQAVKLGEITTQTIACSNEGQMLLSMGKVPEARQKLQEALKLADDWPEDQQDAIVGLLCEVYHGLAVIYLNEGNPEAAWNEAKRALKTAQTIRQPLAIGQSSRTMGEVLTALESPPEDMSEDCSTNPDDHFRASIKAFEELEAEGEVARTLHAYSRSLAKRGRRVPAARKLQQATLIFAKLGMVDDASKAAESQAEIF